MTLQVSLSSLEFHTNNDFIDCLSSINNFDFGVLLACVRQNRNQGSVMNIVPRLIGWER